MFIVPTDIEFSTNLTGRTQVFADQQEQCDIDFRKRKRSEKTQLLNHDHRLFSNRSHLPQASKRMITYSYLVNTTTTMAKDKIQTCDYCEK